MKKLTKREQSLLFVLAILIVFGVGVVYWLMPAIEAKNMLDEELNTLKNEQLSMQHKIAQTTQINSQKEKLINDVADLIANLSDPLAGENFDVLAQELTARRSLSMQSIEYGVIEVVQPNVTGTQVQQYEYNLKELVDNYRNYQEPGSQVIATEHEVMKQTVIIKVQGNYHNIKALISDLNMVDKTTFVKSVDYKRKKETETIDEITQTKTLEEALIEVEVYFLEKKEQNGHYVLEK